MNRYILKIRFVGDLDFAIEEEFKSRKDIDTYI